LRALGLPAPPRRLDARRRGAAPARARVPAALGRAEDGVRGLRDRAVGDALLRPRSRAGLRPSLTARGAPAPVRRVALFVVLVALVAPAAASAHATLRSEFPGFQQELAAGPRVVRLHFDQSVQLPSIEVLDVNGVNHAAPAVSRGRDVSARVGRLPRGAYTIRWHALSSDGHVVSGVWTFGVRVAAPPPTEAYGASGPTRTEHVVRWLYFLALALTIGALGFRLVVVRGLAVPPAVER